MLKSAAERKTNKGRGPGIYKPCERSVTLKPLRCVKKPPLLLWGVVWCGVPADSSMSLFALTDGGV